MVVILNVLLKKIYIFYWDGFRSMVVGRKLWLIIFIKLFVMFAVLKIFFFPNYLDQHFSTDQQKAEHVLSTLTGAAILDK